MNDNKFYHFLKNRYLVCFTILFFFGIILSINSGFADNGTAALYASVIVIAAVILSAGLLKLFLNKNFIIKISGLIISLLIGISYPVLYNSLFNEEILSFDQCDALVYGIIVSEPKISSSGKTLTATLKTEYIKSGDKEFFGKNKIKIALPVESEISYGNGIIFKSLLSLPTEKLGDFEYRRYLMSQGCCLFSYVKEFSFYEPGASLWDKFCNLGFQIRKEIKQFLNYTVKNSELNALIKGIMLGDKSDFSDDLYSEMSGSGFMHIAAVSGLHIGFLCELILFIFKKFPFQARSIAPIPILIIFMSVSDFTPSVCRASIMMILILAANILFKTPDTMTSLFASCLYLCLTNPYIVLNISFILSFTATLSLIIFIKPFSIITDYFAAATVNIQLIQEFCKKTNRSIESLNKIISYMFNMFTIPLACQIGIMPIMAHTFGNLTWLSFLGNIIVIPCTMIAFTAGILDFAIYIIYPKLSVIWANIIINPTLTIIHKTAAFFSQFSYEPKQNPAFISISIYYSLCIVLYHFLNRISKQIPKNK